MAEQVRGNQQNISGEVTGPMAGGDAGQIGDRHSDGGHVEVHNEVTAPDPGGLTAPEVVKMLRDLNRAVIGDPYDIHHLGLVSTVGDLANKISSVIARTGQAEHERVQAQSERATMLESIVRLQGQSAVQDERIDTVESQYTSLRSFGWVLSGVTMFNVLVSVYQIIWG